MCPREVHEFEKPGEYGDEVKAGEAFRFVPDEASPEIQAVMKTLAPGDRVKLGWNHDYVTRSGKRPDGGDFESKSPDRSAACGGSAPGALGPEGGPQNGPEFRKGG